MSGVCYTMNQYFIYKRDAYAITLIVTRALLDVVGFSFFATVLYMLGSAVN